MYTSGNRGVKKKELFLRAADIFRVEYNSIRTRSRLRV